MSPRRLQLIGILGLLALVIAFLLQDVVEELIVRPLVYFFWSLGMFYRYIPQPLLWLLLVLAMLYVTLGAIADKLVWSRPAPPPRKVRGPLDELASQIRRKDQGIYFKWQIARTLGEVALDLQEMRRHVRRRQLEFDPSDPVVTPEVRKYLDAGLNSSFSDFPIAGGLPVVRDLKPVPATPFDGEIGPVLDYLESQMENTDDRRRA